jgi:beta-lactamase superfamily II metal-dependent hydrolase
MPTTKLAMISTTNIPSSVTIRMYNVGFGDCFLLTFHYADAERHMLIDYGSTAAPKNVRGKYMVDVANDIKSNCKGKLDILVATHRHRDHISGFATDGDATGSIIASLKPDHVIQPWTEDPATKPAALTATTTTYNKGKPSQEQITSHFLGSLDDMHRIAGSIAKLASSGQLYSGPVKRNQLTFLGENNLKNISAVKNLMSMGDKGKAHYVNAGMKLNDLLPGVSITVLGPPTLKQSDSIRKERAKDPDEFWQFRSFWSSQSLAIGGRPTPGVTSSQSRSRRRSDQVFAPNVRWFIAQSRQIHADQTLELVRDLDSVMNNTSVILLFEIGNRKLLFPGDAQIENWSYALNNSTWQNLLKDVNLYKVGHHGSLNATPRSLWKLFVNKGDELTYDRLETLCSTKSGKHGDARSGTEVPRALLVAEMEKESAFSSTESYKAPNKLSSDITVAIAEGVKDVRRRKPASRTRRIR